MTLEDLFTLTEIKNGLMVTSRVEELVSVMQSNHDSLMRNARDACRQWTAVASTIAATKNRECLDVFVNSDGLLYLGSWLAEAQMLAEDSTDENIEESILALLDAFQNIGVGSSKFVSSEIWATVKNLVDHGSSRVRNKARKLFGGWNINKAYDLSEHGIETCSNVHEAQTRFVVVNGENNVQNSTVTLCSSFQNGNEKHLREIADEALLAGSSEENNPEQAQGLEVQNDKVQLEANIDSFCSNTRIETLYSSSSDDFKKEVQETISFGEKISMRETSGPTLLGVVPTGSSGLIHAVRNCSEGPSNDPLNTEISKENIMGVYEKSGGAVSVTSSSAGHLIVSSDSNIASIELEKNSVLQGSLAFKELTRNVSATLSGSHDLSIAKNSNHVHITDSQDSENSLELSGHSRHRKVENDQKTANAKKEGEKNDKNHSNRRRRVKATEKRSSSRSMTVSQCLGAIDRTTADIELGIVDALDVATKVAQEVAREVDSEEPSCRSSEELSDESGQSGSEDSQDDVLHTGPPFKGLSVGENLSFDVMDDKNNKPENGMMNSDDVEKSPAVAAARFEIGREKSPCDFDLNHDIFPDERDVIMSNISTTAATTTTVMSVSHYVSTFGMSTAAPLQLERTLSRNGSATSRVFHSAVPHEAPSGDLKEKQVIFHGIDLNVAEVGDDQVEDPTPWKQFPSSSSNFRSGEPSHEANPWGSKRFKLDLNCMNEDYDMPPPSDLKMETRLFLSDNAQQGASSPTSLSSVHGVSFDLNDRPQFLVDSCDQGPYHKQPWSTAHYREPQFDEPVISILGTKVDVYRKHSVSLVASCNGKTLEPTTGLYMARMGNSLGLAPDVSFSPAPVSYNGLTSPPGLSTSSPMYIPGSAIPYMVDSRGTPLTMSQIIGSTPYVQQPFPQQHMFMSLAGGSPILNASVGPSLGPNFDQSSGFGAEVGNRESLSMRQFLSLEQSGAMGEHSGANVEPPANSLFSIGRKRKEPATRWAFPPLK